MNRFYRPELDALRFGAFALVFLFHTGGSIGGPAVFSLGAYGVDLFFLLSAFLITELFRRERAQNGAIDIRAFYWRRVLRIWPLYFGFIAVVFVGSKAIHQIQMPADATLALMLFVGNWYLVGHAFFSPAGILWSVSIEEQFYLVAPWLMRWLERRALIVVVMVGLVLVAAGVRLVLLRAGGGSGLWYNTMTRLDPIAVGMMAAFVLDGRAPQWRAISRLALAFAGMAALYVAAIWLHGEHPRGVLDGSLSYPLATVGVLCLFLSVLGSRIEWTPLLYLGRISYGLYVFHLLALNVAKAGLLVRFGECPWWARGAIALPLTIVLAAASYRWLEVRFLRIKLQLAASRVAMTAWTALPRKPTE